MILYLILGNTIVLHPFDNLQIIYLMFFYVNSENTDVKFLNLYT